MKSGINSKEYDNQTQSALSAEEVRQKAIFYAGNRVFLNPKQSVATPDALTPDPALKIPLTRAATDIYLSKKNSEAINEARSKMTKKEREEEEKKQQEALTRIADSSPPPTQGGNVLEKAKKKKEDRQKIKHDPQLERQRQNAILNILGSMKAEDNGELWEQQTQAGCTFWRHSVSREIRLEPPKLINKLPERKDALYPLGTGATLFKKDEYKKERLWLVARGMTLPAIRFGHPTEEEIAERQRNAAARNIQKAAKTRAEARRKQQAKNSDTQTSGSALPEVVPSLKRGSNDKEKVLQEATKVGEEEDEYEEDEYGDDADDYEDDDG